MLYPISSLNDGSSSSYWNDGTPGVYPDWAEINWGSPQAIGLVKLRLPVMPTFTLPLRTMGSLTLQYKDNAGIYRNIKTLTSVVAPTSDDGSQVINIETGSTITTAIRIRFDAGNGDGWSFMEEIEAYGSPNMAATGTATASSVHASGLFPIAGLIDGGSTSYWNDGTPGVYPDLAEINWGSPQAVGLVKLRLPVMPTFTLPLRTMGSLTLQYKDHKGVYRNIKTLTNVVAPASDDGSQVINIETGSTITTAIRIRFDAGNGDGWSFMEEIEAYGSPNMAATGTATASSVHASGLFPIAGLIDGGSTSYWNDGTPGVYPDWAEINWGSPQAIGLVKLRLPVMPTFTLPLRTMGSLTLQYKDNAGIYRNIKTLTSVVAPTSDDGSQVINILTGDIETTAIRIRFDVGNGDGWSFMEEIQAYAKSNLASLGNVTASSVHANGLLFPIASLTDGESTTYWNDGTPGVYPDWAEITWESTQAIGLVKLRLPVMPTFTLPLRTMGSLTLQYKDNAGFYQNIKTLTNIVAPASDDGSQFIYVETGNTITTAIRVRFDAGNGDGWSFMEEIQVFSSPNIASAGTAAASSVHASGLFPIASLIDGRNTSYWNDGTPGVYPDWVELNWENPQAIGLVKLRLPVMPTFTLPLRTIGSLTLQYKDNAGIYQNIKTLTNVVAPIVDDGSQVTSLETGGIDTTAIRLQFDVGSSDGWSFMEEIEVYPYQIKYVYNQTGQLKTKRLSNGDSISYEYDQNGNLVKKIIVPKIQTGSN
ncbi:hypothetical protein OB236_23785 [Paenibacillus sp. WQ 127069]|uniref:F5/8 type C domain-containing protein n=2 Tax=Paenibacillus baimaensis TaxID=2982185 RepID=A0ABT2UKI6_9BACL|nr:hypothetical protein [Paenibacillus sp. WQ 127069]